MKLRYLALLALSGALFSAWPVHAQDRVPVYVEYRGQDAVGTRLRYHVSQHLGRSSTLISSPLKSESLLTLVLVTLAPPGDEYVMTTYGVTVLLTDNDRLSSYLDGAIGYCGADRVASCAEDILVMVETQRELLLRVLAEIGAQETIDQTRTDFW